jgi:DNA ligase-1
MKAYEVVAKLEKVTGKKEKEQILIEAFMSGDYEFFIGAQYALDQLISFGVKKVALIDDSDVNPDNPGTVKFNDFITLADKLATRKLTGHAARDAINKMASECHGPTWNNFYRRVLLKNLRCGVDTTINKVLEKMKAYPKAKELMIPVFSCQLAQDGNKPVNQKKMQGKKYLDLKLDGARLLTILNKEDGTVTQYSRVGAPNTNFPQITEPLKTLLPIIKESLVIDGEVISKSFSDLMKAFGRKTKTSNDAKLAAFDLIPLADFKKGFCSLPQSKRHWLLSEFQSSGLFTKHTNDVVYVVPKVLVDLDTEEGREQYRKFVNNAATLRTEGEKVGEKIIEGVMVKDVNAPYECKRVDKWLKIKPFVSVSLTIKSVEMGNADGKYKNVIGNVNCEGEDDGMKISVSVQPPSDKAREEWVKSPPIGFIAEIEADALTLEEGSTVYSLRFPRFKGFRGFKPGEKI